MSGWYYSAVKVRAEFGGGYEYTVAEVFPGLEGIDGKMPYTENAKFYGQTPEDLVEWLRDAADDIEKYGVVNDDEQLEWPDSDERIDNIGQNGNDGLHYSEK